MECDIFILSTEFQTVVEDLKIVEDLFDFSKLDKIHDIFRNKIKKLVDKFKFDSWKYLERWIYLSTESNIFN